MQKSALKAKLENLESVRIENACVVAWGKRPMPGECAAVTADEADEYVDVVGSSTPVHSDMESEGFTFIKSVGHVFLKDLGGVPDTSGIPLLKFLNNLIFTLL